MTEDKFVQSTREMVAHLQAVLALADARGDHVLAAIVCDALARLDPSSGYEGTVLG